MPDTDLNHLASYFRPLASKLLDICKQNGIECRVVDTLRSASEQQVKLSQRTSWTSKSKHEPQPP